MSSNCTFEKRTSRKRTITKKRDYKNSSKKLYGSAKNVLLTDEQHASLTAKYGEKLPEMVEYLSNYIATTGKSYKDHNRVLRDWVEDAVRRKKLEKTRA